MDQRTKQAIDEQVATLTRLAKTKRTPGRMQQILNAIWRLDALWQRYQGTQVIPPHMSE